MSLAEDLEFAAGEFDSQAAVLRYVAAINPQASREEFVAACVAAGYPANSSANRFRESRKFDSENYGHVFDKAGRLISEGTL